MRLKAIQYVLKRFKGLLSMIIPDGEYGEPESNFLSAIETAMTTNSVDVAEKCLDLLADMLNDTKVGAGDMLLDLIFGVEAQMIEGYL